MMLTEFEKKRAANMIWNGAHNYKVSPGYRMYDYEGRADLYWNTIIGASYIHFDWKKLIEFYSTFHETLGQETYETLFWLALEHSTFEKEKHLRESLPLLRREYCKRKLQEFIPSIAESREGWILEGHYKVALGEDCGLPDLVDRKLLKEVEIPGKLNTEEWIQSLSKTLQKYFTYLPGLPAALQKKKRQLKIPRLFFWLKDEKGLSSQSPKKLVLGLLERSKGGADTRDLETASEKYQQITEEGLRKYIQSYFGKPLFDAKKAEALEKACCIGNHQGARLYFTDGKEEENLKGFAAKMRKEMEGQRKKNEKAYRQQETSNQTQIFRLSQRLKNALLSSLEPSPVLSNQGKLIPSLLWRPLYLKKNTGAETTPAHKIFQKEVADSQGSLTVDLLLDASSSQIHRMETVSQQGYILAKALDNCQIPVRVFGYSSMSGYTVLNRYRDYTEKNKNKEIFRYFTTGANRDGLALSALLEQLKENTASHRLVIWLTDLSPNDLLEVKNKARNYSGDLAISDIQEMVHKAHMEGIYVLLSYTGKDKDIPNAQKIFGRSFVKVNSLDNFAELMGKLIQAEIQRM